MREKMIDAIMNAISNQDDIRISIEIGKTAITTHFTPEYADIEDNSIIIYSMDDIYVLNISDVDYNDNYNAYICNDVNNCIVLIEL